MFKVFSLMLIIFSILPDLLLAQEGWESGREIDRMDDSNVTWYAQSPAIMIENTSITARISYACRPTTDIELLAVRFSSVPPFRRDSRANSINASLDRLIPEADILFFRIRWDNGPAITTLFFQINDNPEIHFALGPISKTMFPEPLFPPERLKIEEERIRSHDSVLIEFTFRGSVRYGKFSLLGASRAIDNARSQCFLDRTGFELRY